jgi:NADPH:quinone reductase-like Zn-dependent oxidoreductase
MWIQISGLKVLGRGRVVSIKPATTDLVALKDLIDGGELAPVVERTYPLAAVADAMEHVATGHVRGKVVVTT